MQKNLFQVVHQAATNEMGETKLSTNNNQDNPMLNYLLKITPSKFHVV
jgi:hypothetical protein